MIVNAENLYIDDDQEQFKDVDSQEETPQRDQQKQ